MAGDVNNGGVLPLVVLKSYLYVVNRCAANPLHIYEIQLMLNRC